MEAVFNYLAKHDFITTVICVAIVLGAAYKISKEDDANANR